MKKILLIGVVAFSLQSCATLFSGTKDQITFRSYPADATVLLNGREIGKTNNSIVIKRRQGKNAMITYHKDGYKDLTFPHEVKTVTGYWVNFLGYFAGIIPGIVFTMTDVATSAYAKPRYETYEKTLEPSK